MPGETEDKPSAWTIDSSMAHIRSLIEANDRRYEQRFVAQEKAVADALASQEKAVTAALLAADRAVAKAENAAEKRFESVNEFRAQLADQAAHLMPRLESEARHAQNGEKLLALDQRTTEAFAIVNSRLDMMTGRDKGIGDFAGWIVGAVGLLVAIIGVTIAIVNSGGGG